MKRLMGDKMMALFQNSEPEEGYSPQAGRMSPEQALRRGPSLPARPPQKGGMTATLMREGNCVSCGQGLLDKGSTSFTCPTCDTTIGRCGSCREQAVAYTCPDCGFQGP